MSSEISSRSTRSPIFSASSVSKAIEWMVNGGATLPKEWTISTRFASAAEAETPVNQRSDAAQSNVSHPGTGRARKGPFAAPLAAMAGVAPRLREGRASALPFWITVSKNVVLSQATEGKKQTFGRANALAGRGAGQLDLGLISPTRARV